MPLPPTNTQATMSSQEIAELTGKETKHVNRDIRNMLEDLQRDGPKLDHQFSEEKDARGYTSCFHLTRRLTDCLLTGYSAVARIRVIDRWHELEGDQRPMTRLEFARLQVKLIEELERKEAEVESLRVTLDESSSWASVKRMEARYRTAYDWRVLKRVSTSMGVEVQKVFDQNYGTVNSYHDRVWQAAYGVHVKGATDELLHVQHDQDDQHQPKKD